MVRSSKTLATFSLLCHLAGYINENGSLHLERFEKFMEKLSEFDFENFEEIRDDLLWMEAKSGKKSKRLAVEDVK